MSTSFLEEVSCCSRSTVHHQPVAAIDACDRCTANLCQSCKRAGCCGAKPAKSWVAAVPELAPAVPRPALPAAPPPPTAIRFQSPASAAIQARVVELRLAGQTIEAIAADVGISPAAVKHRIARQPGMVRSGRRRSA